MLAAAAGILFGVCNVAVKALTGIVGADGVLGLVSPWLARRRRRLGRRLLRLGRGRSRTARPSRSSPSPAPRRTSPASPAASSSSATRCPATSSASSSRPLAFVMVIVASALTPAPVRSAEGGRAGAPAASRRSPPARPRVAAPRYGPPGAALAPAAARRTLRTTRADVVAGLPTHGDYGCPPPRVDRAKGVRMATIDQPRPAGPPGARQAALWMHFSRMGALRRPRGADHRARRGLLRLRRPRQALPRRPQRALLREHRPRPRRRRPGRRRPGQGARLLHELVLRAPARDRAGRQDRRARARRPQPRLLHQRRQRGRRVGDQARPPVPQAHAATRTRRRSSPARSPTTAPRSARSTATGITALRAALRAVRARRLPRAQHEPLPPAGGPGAENLAEADRTPDRVRGPRHGRGRDPGAGPERRRLLHAARRLLPAGPRDLRRATTSC